MKHNSKAEAKSTSNNALLVTSLLIFGSWSYPTMNISNNPVRTSKLIAREQLVCLSGGEVDGHRDTKNPLQLATPIRLNPEVIVTTHGSLVAHIIMHEATNQPFPKSDQEVLRFCRFSYPFECPTVRVPPDVYLMQAQSKSIPIFLEAKRSRTKKVKYVGHWKVVTVKIWSSHCVYKERDRSASIGMRLDRYDEQFASIIEIACGITSVAQLVQLDFDDANSAVAAAAVAMKLERAAAQAKNTTLIPTSYLQNVVSPQQQPAGNEDSSSVQEGNEAGRNQMNAKIGSMRKAVAQHAHVGTPKNVAPKAVASKPAPAQICMRLRSTMQAASSNRPARATRKTTVYADDDSDESSLSDEHAAFSHRPARATRNADKESWFSDKASFADIAPQQKSAKDPPIIDLTMTDSCSENESESLPSLQPARTVQAACRKRASYLNEESDDSGAVARAEETTCVPVKSENLLQGINSTTHGKRKRIKREESHSSDVNVKPRVNKQASQADGDDNFCCRDGSFDLASASWKRVAPDPPPSAVVVRSAASINPTAQESSSENEMESATSLQHATTPKVHFEDASYSKETAPASNTTVTSAPDPPPSSPVVCFAVSINPTMKESCVKYDMESTPALQQATTTKAPLSLSARNAVSINPTKKGSCCSESDDEEASTMVSQKDASVSKEPTTSASIPVRSPVNNDESVTADAISSVQESADEKTTPAPPSITSAVPQDATAAPPPIRNISSKQSVYFKLYVYENATAFDNYEPFVELVVSEAAATISFAQIRNAVNLQIVPDNLLLQNNRKWRFTVPDVGDVSPGQEGMDAIFPFQEGMDAISKLLVRGNSKDTFLVAIKLE